MTVESMTGRFTSLLAFVGFAVFSASPTIAAAPSPPIAGYTCMGLNITNAQAHDFNFEVPIRAAPNSSSPVVEIASGTFPMRSPRHEVGGFVEVLTATVKPGWIAAQYVKPYFAPLDPGAKCFPVLSPTGRVMFSYSH